jgi:hypothetical protein
MAWILDALFHYKEGSVGLPLKNVMYNAHCTSNYITFLSIIGGGPMNTVFQPRIWGAEKESSGKVTSPMTTTIRIPPYFKWSTILQTFFNDRT